MDGLEEKLNKILSDPEALGSVMKMAQSLTGGGGGREEEPQEEAGMSNALASGGLMDLVSGMDPQMLGRIMGLLNEYNRKDDRRTKLLSALKPYMHHERQSKIEQAAHIVRIARTAKMALSNFGGGKDV